MKFQKSNAYICISTTPFPMHIYRVCCDLWMLLLSFQQIGISFRLLQWKNVLAWGLSTKFGEKMMNDEEDKKRNDRRKRKRKNSYEEKKKKKKKKRRWKRRKTYEMKGTKWPSEICLWHQEVWPTHFVDWTKLFLSFPNLSLKINFYKLFCVNS